MWKDRVDRDVLDFKKEEEGRVLTTRVTFAITPLIILNLSSQLVPILVTLFHTPNLDPRTQKTCNSFSIGIKNNVGININTINTLCYIISSLKLNFKFNFVLFEHQSHLTIFNYEIT